MAITRLGPHGSMRSHGTFGAKSPSGATPAPKITSLGLHGSQRAYATFAAKTASGSGGSGAFCIFGGAILTGTPNGGWL